MLGMAVVELFHPLTLLLLVVVVVAGSPEGVVRWRCLAGVHWLGSAVDGSQRSLRGRRSTKNPWYWGGGKWYLAGGLFGAIRCA